MAINFGTYGSGTSVPNAADEYAGQEKLLGLNELEDSVQEGIERGEAQVDRKLKLERDEAAELRRQTAEIRAQESHELAQIINQNSIDEHNYKVDQREKERDENIRLLLESGETDPAVDNENSLEDTVQEEADLITRTPREGKDYGVDVRNLSDAELKKRVTGLANFRNGIQGDQNIAAQLLDNPTIDIDAMGEKYDVLEAIAEDGYKKGNWNPGTQSYDKVVTVVRDGKKVEITIPGGDLNAYVGDVPSTTNLVDVIDETKAKHPVLTKLAKGGTASPAELEQVKVALEQSFDSQQKIDSFVKSVNPDDPAVIKALEDGVVTPEEAAEIALGGIRGFYGDRIVKPTPKTAFTPRTAQAFRQFEATGDYQALGAADGVETLNYGEDDKGNLVVNGLTLKDGTKIELTGDKERDRQTIFNKLNLNESYNWVPNLDVTKLTPELLTQIPQSQVQSLSPSDKVKYFKYKADLKKKTVQKNNQQKKEEKAKTVTESGKVKNAPYVQAEKKLDEARKEYDRLQIEEADICKSKGLESTECKNATKRLNQAQNNIDFRTKRLSVLEGNLKESKSEVEELLEGAEE